MKKCEGLKKIQNCWCRINDVSKRLPISTAIFQRKFVYSSTRNSSEGVQWLTFQSFSVNIPPVICRQKIGIFSVGIKQNVQAQRNIIQSNLNKMTDASKLRFESRNFWKNQNRHNTWYKHCKVDIQCAHYLHTFARKFSWNRALTYIIAFQITCTCNCKHFTAVTWWISSILELFLRITQYRVRVIAH